MEMLNITIYFFLYPKHSMFTELTNSAPGPAI